jgi:hypothetical protein
MLSYVRRTLSPSHLGFSFDWIPLRFSVGEESSVRLVAWREEGDDASRWAAPGPWLLRVWRGQAGFGWAALEWGGKGVAVGSGSASGRVLAHSQINIKNSFSFSKYVYNSQNKI